ncbi:class I SAM-dependent methyltransferase [Inquilinus limosus]|uniref:class I SAM-dependent methyltransferase n=1 Tax=Inquilinus limosus TaxID=171674 RepID=UPI00068C502B|nr:class I SAM-dependent methyltransferase [Inquilinus limosus]
MSWNGGYVTDVAYTTGYYAPQTPGHIALACLMGNVLPGFARDPDRLTYLELGCGRGRGALCLAASNPGWRVIAVDFMPAHIAEARELAADAGIGNIEFIEADIATLDPDTLPEVDVASAHGLWSWVSDEVRAGIVRLLGRRLRPGGALHLSYNALPAWQGVLGLQRLIRTAGERIDGRSDRKAAGAMELVKALGEAGAFHLDQSDLVRVLKKDLPGMPPEYLAHEYMNADWRPCFHADVAAALGDAKLDYVASGEILENFPDLMLTAEQRAVIGRTEDAGLRELMKDMCLSRSLRHDIFVRGPRGISGKARDAALTGLWLTLTRRAEDFSYAVNMPAGKAELERAFYEPVVAALAEGPRRVGDLLALPGVVGKRDNPAELVGMLVGTGQAVTLARPEAEIGEEAARLNSRVAARILQNGDPPHGALASLRLGSGLRCGGNDTLATAMIGRFGLDAPVERWAEALGLPPEGEERDRFLREAEETRERRGPVWRHAGII